MTTTPKTLLQGKYIENAETTQYTAPAGFRTIIDKATVNNATAAPVTLVLQIVPNGAAADAIYVVKSFTVGAGRSDLLAELVGHILNPGDSISTLAGTSSALTIRLSGREVSI